MPRWVLQLCLGERSPAGGGPVYRFPSPEYVSLLEHCTEHLLRYEVENPLAGDSAVLGKKGTQVCISQ